MANSGAPGVGNYARNAERLVPGYRHLQQMACLLLAEEVGSGGQVLVVGAGGGSELKVFAETHPDWSFVGVDPSKEMLDLAQTTLGAAAARVEFHEGYVVDAPTGPFDGATCLLTLHFLPREERKMTLVEIAKRLKPGAPLVVAHHSFPVSPEEKKRWLSRYAEFSVALGVPRENAEKAIDAIDQRLPVSSPAEDVEILAEAGFRSMQLFYAGFTFKGWVGYRSP